MRKSRLQSLLLLLALGCMTCLGCAIGHQQTYTKYEPQDDSFHILKIYSNLNATTGKQTVDKKVLDHIVLHWKHRQSLIPHPLQYLDHGATVHQRTGQHTFQIHSLGTPSNKPPETQTTKVDLNAIEITPGEFYLNAHGNACYYHQVKIPGKTIDAMLKEMLPSIAEGLAKLVEQQNQQRKTGITEQWTWEDLRKNIVNRVNNPNPNYIGPSPDSKLSPLDQESLNLWTQAGTKGQVDLSRKGDVFQLIIPLSKRDSLEAVTTFDLAEKTIIERAKTDPRIVPGHLEFLAAFTLRHEPKKGLAISLSYTQLAKSIHTENTPAKPDALLKQNYKTTAAALKTKGISFKKSFDINKVKAKYTPGK